MDKRTGLTTSISSHSSSSVLLSNVPLTQKLIEFSVDDVFARYTVPQVQKLHHDYNQDITKAKAELHQLVGGKYRDLIRIAEEIEIMNVSAQKIDNTLVDLSFSNSNFVAFGKNKFSKFNSRVREQNVKAAYKLSKKTILNNVINNELIGYDLKLQTGSLKKTQALVHLAKTYYTIDKIFANVLQSHSNIAATYHKLKSNLIAYLEKNLALYTFASDSPLISSGLSVEALIEQSENGQWLESESYDFLSEEYDIDDYPYSESDDLATGVSNTPIVNYIFAYIIITHNGQDVQSFESIAAKLVRLKTDHLQNIIEDVSRHPSASNISFYKLLRNVEATAICVNDHLVKDGELKSRLKFTKAWKASELIGFHNWFEDDDVLFDFKIEDFDKSKSTKLLAEYHESCRDRLEQFVKSLFQRCCRSSEVAVIDRAILSVLYNVVSGFNKLGSLASYEERECYLLLSIEISEVISRLTKSAIEIIGKASRDYLHQLMEGESSVSTSAKQSLLVSIPDNCHEHDLFSEKIILSMDESIDSYLSLVQRSATLTVSSKEELVGSLSHWLKKMKYALFETKADGDNVVGKIRKQLEKAASDSGSLSKTFDDQVTRLNTAIFSDVYQQMSKFINGLFKLVEAEEKPNKDLNLGIIKYLLEVKDFVQTISAANAEAELIQAVERMLSKLFENVLNSAFNLNLRGDSLRDNLKRAIVVTSEEGLSDSTPQRAQLSVYSILFGLVEELLDLDLFEQQKVISFLTHKTASNAFLEKKNEVLTNLVLESLAHTSVDAERLENLVVTENESPVSDGQSESNSAKFTELQAQQTFANVLFVLNFTTKQIVKPSDPIFETCLKDINGRITTPLKQTTLEYITKGVTEQFNASKDLLLPLLLN